MAFQSLCAKFLVVACEPNYILIRDIGPWTQHPTVTNDAKGVVQRLARAGYLPNGRRLFYFDSENHMDEILVKNGCFAGFMVLK